MTGLRGRRPGWVGTEGTGSCFFHARRGPGGAVTVSSSAPPLPCWIFLFALYSCQPHPRRYRYLPATFTSLHPLHDFPYFLDPDIDTLYVTSPTTSAASAPHTTFRGGSTSPKELLAYSRAAGFYVSPILCSTTISPLLSSGIFFSFSGIFFCLWLLLLYPIFCALSWGRGGEDRRVCVVLGVCVCVLVWAEVGGEERGDGGWRSG